MPERQPKTSWVITCRSPEKADHLRHWIVERINLDRIMTDMVSSRLGGVETVQAEEHRLGDYFADIRILPDSQKDSAAFRLQFCRRPESGRFWKDLMVNVLQEIETSGQRVSIERDAE